MFVACCEQKRAARLCFAQQSSYELGTLAYRIITGSAVVQGADLPSIPGVYPYNLHILLPRLVMADPGAAICEYFGSSCPLVVLCTLRQVHCVLATLCGFVFLIVVALVSFFVALGHL